jgi:transcriptional regulator with XRE-family HTH domain
MQSTDKFPVENTLAMRLQILRKGRKWTLQELAEKLGCGRSYLSRLETGKAKNPSTDFLRKASTVLGVSEAWLELGIGKADATPSRSQLEEDTQFLIAFTTFAEEMTVDQLLRCVGRLSQHPRLTEQSRVFWTKMIGPWFLVKVDLEKAASERAKKAAAKDTAKRRRRKKR